jgi:mannose-6-phosphate isomerase
MVWGGRRLGEVLHKDLPTAGTYGESWEISDHAMHQSVAVAGPWAGRTLRRLMLQEREALLGSSARHHAVFPWLIKFLDANDWLSVQVHPDEEAVKRLWPGEGSKTEAWFVMDRAQDSRIYAGLRPGINATELQAAVAAGRVAECLHSFVPEPGDCVFLPAGTVHAVGGGVLMAEIQQTSDATFRIYDWNRKDHLGNARKLHVEEALAAIHWGQGQVSPIRNPTFAKFGPECSELSRTLVECPYFIIQYVESSGPLTWGNRGRLQAIVILEGEGKWSTHSEERLASGQTWLLPASMPRVELQPRRRLKLLVCSLP